MRLFYHLLVPHSLTLMSMILYLSNLTQAAAAAAAGPVSDDETSYRLAWSLQRQENGAVAAAAAADGESEDEQEDRKLTPLEKAVRTYVCLCVCSTIF